MPRPIWKGVITFGMISIPVAMYGATESKDVSFNQLHKECNSRIKQKRFCPVCERDVDGSEIVKGYEYSKNQYVLLDDEDFDKLPVPSKQTIELSGFVEAAEIDPVYHEKSYYLEPEAVGVKAYALLLRALETKQLNAVAKISVRTKERLCALRAKDGTIMMETLFYPDEVRLESKPQVPDVLVSDRELAMAEMLIDMLREKFDATKYSDGYRETLMAMIEAKVNATEMVAAPTPVPAAQNVTDLMAALRASVEAMQKQKPETPIDKVA